MFAVTQPADHATPIVMQSHRKGAHLIATRLQLGCNPNASASTHPNTMQESHFPLAACDADLDSGKVAVLAGGTDFVSAPRLSPDGKQLAWVAWDHPNMPWDDTVLYLADVSSDGKLSNQHKVKCHALGSSS